MSIEVVGVNQSWTQLSSILLPVSVASPAISRNSTTTTTTKTSPPSPARSEKAITLTESIDDSGNSPLSTEPPSDPLSDSCLAVSSIEDDGQGSNENGEIEEADLSQLTATAENGDEVGQQQDQQLLSATLLPPLPDLIPIRRSQQLQLQEIDVNSCDTNQQQDRKSEQQPQSPTSASSQILSISNKQPVEIEEENLGGEEDQEEEEEDQTINYDDTTSNNNERDDPQHSTFEEATSTSLATTSTVLDNQSTITASTTTTATTFSLYPTDSNMSQQHSSSMLLDTALTAVPSLTGLPKTGAKKRGRKIKTEIEDPELCPIPHRKSDRRRVARDIFLVFEEHPANRRRGKGGKAKQPKTRPKSKFAHLMTEPKRHNKKGATAATVGTVPPVRIKSEPKTPSTTCNTLRKNTPSVAPASVVKTPATKTSTPKATPASKSTNSTTVPRVKPIFLFVKQDDTRIVEVRCEDYDKRNRIRLTKTANGWRAIPRTDPSSTRFAKLLPNPAVKVKQEMIEEALRNAAEVPVQQKPPPSPSSSPQQPEPPSSPIPTAETEVVAPLEPLKPLKILQPAELLKASLKSAASHAAKKKKKKKKKKKRKLAEEHLKEQKEAARVEELEESDKHHSIEEDEEEEEQESEEPHAEVPQNPIISTEPNHLVYESTNHEREEESLHEEHDTEIKQIDDDDDEEVQEVPIAVETPEIIKQPELTPEAEDEDVEEVIPQYEEDENGLMLHHHHMEPNNNEPTEELAKNLTQISDDLELDEMPQFMQDVNAVRALQLCPETGLFIQKTSIVGEDHGIDREPEPVEPELNHHEHEDHEDHDAPVVLSDSFDDSDVDTKNLKDLIDDADLLQHCSDNAMSGAELLDSLVKRGCEDNHISGDEPSIKETICLDDFENEDDDVLMQPEPVADIISRLGGSLAASPKCLSFNEAGEIEGLHGELFQSNTQNDPFSRHTLEELSITIKDLEKSAEESYNSPVKQKPAESVTIVSPDSCVDEMPKDLTCKKSQIAAEKEKPSQPQPLLERPNSRSSDAIQSPQPSGLPAVPPSPDLVHSNKSSKNVFLEQLLNSSNSISPKICSSVTVTPIKIPNAPAKQQQKEPLDLGKHRKSASPTVSCSEEAKRIQTVTIDEESPDEPLQKRIKREEIEEDIRTEKSHTDNLIEMLSSGKDPDPLTQLRLLIRNPEWKVPDPILVPKDRLSAVLASPAREIPLLLTTRPELRLPEAFAYPAILQDPDILVISMAQLETILQKQVEITRPKAKTPPIPQVTIEAIPNPVKNRAPPEKPVPAPSPDITVSSKKTAPSPTTPQPAKQQAANNFLNPLMGDIDAATLAAFNQMLWLPYIGQMAPEFIKAIAGLQNGNGLAELMPLLQQQQNAQIANQQQPNQKSAFPTPPQFHPMAAAAAAAGLANPLAASAAFQNPLEMAMWQEALTQAQMQRMMKLNAAAALAAQQQQQREIPKKSTNSEAKANTNRSHYGSATSSSKQTPSNPPPPYHHSQTSHQRHQMSSAAEKSNLSSARSVPNPFYRPPGTSNSDSSAAHRAKQKSQQHHQDQKPRVTCKSLSNLLQPERLSEAKMSNLMAMPGFDFGFNGSAAGNVAAAAAAANPFQFASAAAAAAAAASAGRTSSGTGQYGGSSSNSATGCGAGSANNVNHSAALHRTNHSASSMLGNMTPSQHQHQQLQHHQQQLQHHQLQHQHQQQQHQQQQQQQLHHQQQQQHQQQQAKLKVKPGSHLIDPAALQRRLLNCEDMSEVGSTTNGLEEMMTDPNAALWHPLFGNTQKAGYNSPWQWTTVTASGE